ncbi:MAG: exocyst complex component Sec6-domain-containing protein [Piptocephalis tieghemiana]|nr:MAG: exocyst complex component Sec6-domain-containing protein [Piptocephalis tieghemiana]
MDTDPRQAAVARLKELLRYPEDLETKLDLVRKRLQAEQGTAEAQLKTSAQTQYTEIRRGLDELEGVTIQTDTLRNRLRGIYQLRAEAGELQEHYGTIAQISHLHDNMARTQKLMRQFQELHERLDGVEDAFDRVVSTPKKEFPLAADLLRLHFRVSKLEEFRDTVMLGAQNSSGEALRTIARYFQRLDRLSENFSDLFWDQVRGIFGMAMAGDAPLIVALGSIVEKEEAADEAAMALWKADREAGKPTTPEGPEPKAWKQTFLEVMREVVGDRFARWFEEYAEEPFEALEATDWVVDDLEVVKEEIVPRLPASWSLVPYFISEYHQQLGSVVRGIVGGDLDAGQILRALRWSREYQARMKKELGLTDQDLTPGILEGQEDTLIADYMKLIRAKMDEWLMNLVTTEGAEYKERTKPPEEDSEGRYGMGVATIVAQLINQQVDVAMESNRGGLLADVIVQCGEALATMQASWSSLMVSEGKKHQKAGGGPDVPAGLLEYTIALGNEQIRCVELCEDIVERISSLVSGKYAERISSAMDRSMSGFIGVADTAVSILLDMVFLDMTSAFAELFTPAWYERDLVAAIVETMRDYNRDFTVLFKPFLLDRLLDGMVDRFLLGYVQALKGKGVELRVPECSHRFREDLDRAAAFFDEFLPEARVREAFDPAQRLRVLLISPAESLPQDFTMLRKRYADLKPDWIEKVLAKRSDLDKSRLKEVMEEVRNKLEKRPRPDKPSVFGKAAEA